MSKGEWGEHELRLQDENIENVSNTSHLVTYLATFLLPAKESQHRVFVFDLRGPYLSIHMVGKLAMTSRMSAAKQLLEAVGHLHQAGIVHRDLNERNCMWGISPLHDQDRAAKYKALGRPLKQPIPFVDDLWKRGELVSPLVIPEALRTEDFYLGDSQIQRGYPPSQFCSPDRLHGKHPSFACDMWSYMVLFMELYIGVPPFVGGAVSEMVRCLGPLPPDWKGQYVWSDALDEWYDHCTKVDPKHDLAARIRYSRPDVDDMEMRLVLSFMKRVFTYVPEERLSARELMEDPSFKAIMEKYGV